MQYAQIIVNRKQIKLLTYKISSAQLPSINNNILVKVPLGNLEVWGAVVKLVKSSTDIDTSKLKTISSVYPEIQLANSNFRFANWLKDEYLASLAEALFIQIPLNLPKKIKDLALKFPETEPIPHSRKDLLIKYNSRYETISELVNKFITQKKSIRIIIPDLAELSKLQNDLKEFKPLIFSSKISALKRLQLIQDFYNSNKKIIIGGRNLALLPPKKDEVWIVDDPDNFAYKSDQTPKFHLTGLLQYWSTFVQIITLNTIPFSLKPLIKKTNFLKISPDLPFFAPIIIKKEEKLLQNLAFYDQKDTIVILPQMSLKESLFCFKCYHSAFSPCCGSGLSFINKKWECQTCTKIYNSLACVDCGNQYSISQGSKYDQINKSNFSDLKFIHLNETAEINVTSRVIMLGFDYLLDNPSIYSMLDYLKTVVRISQFSKELLIFTQLPNNELFKVLNNSKVSQLQNLLFSTSKKLKSKPFYKIIKLTILENKTKNNAKLIKWLDFNRTNQILEFSGPIKTQTELNFYIYVPIHNWIMFKNSWQNELSPSILNSARIDIDPYRVV